jgi:ankyrin repeat protein
VEAVRQLVEEHGASLDEEVVGETALHFASFYGHLPVVSFLLSRPECRLNKRNLGGTTTTTTTNLTGKVERHAAVVED